MNGELSQALASHCQVDGMQRTPLEGLTINHSSFNNPRTSGVLQPAICVIGQARKQVFYGDSVYTYDPDHYLINSLTMPIEWEMRNVTATEPFLGFSLDIDRTLVSQLMLEMDGQSNSPHTQPVSGIASACALTAPLRNAILRLLQLLDNPMDVAILGPGLKREIFYEVLKGPHGNLLRNCVRNDSGANRITPVVHFIEENFHRALEVTEIADVAGMSSSSLHEHFKQVTGLSPIQFVKSIRLHRARELLLGGRQASDAAYAVGYNSPSQFSREFKRFFGDSPRDVQAG
jgi:AraC-like DNA-binding protein